MKDIKLDFDRKKMLNEIVDNQNRIIQQIKVAVRSWQEDFFINSTFGIDYDTCWGDMLLMKSLVSNQIKEIEGVSDIRSISVEKSKDKNNEVVFVIKAEIIIDNNSINILEVINRGEFL